MHKCCCLLSLFVICTTLSALASLSQRENETESFVPPGNFNSNAAIDPLLTDVHGFCTCYYFALKSALCRVDPHSCVSRRLQNMLLTSFYFSRVEKKAFFKLVKNMNRINQVGFSPSALN